MLEAILKLLAGLLELFRQYQRQQEQKKHEAQASEIEQNPSGWMQDHFSGAPAEPDSVRKPSNLPDNASKTNKAGADDSGDS